MINNEKHSMSWYFDRGLEKKALLLDASNLDWFEFPLFSSIRKEIYRTLEDPSDDMDWGYSYPGGKNQLRELIAEHESFLEDTIIDKNDVIVGGNGVTGVLNFISQFLVKKSIELNKNGIIYPVPAYAGLLKSLTFYNLETTIINTSRENNYCLTYEDIVNNYNDNTIAILITNPGNPACCYIKDNDLRKIISFAKKKNIYIILDAIFEESPNGTNKLARSFLLSNNYEKLIKIKGFSKDIPQLSDLRLGWSICKNNEFNKFMLELGEITNYSNSTFLESLGIVEMKTRVLKDKKETSNLIVEYNNEIENYHNKINETIKETIELVNNSSIFEDCIIPEAGNILFIKIKKEICSKNNILDSHDLFVYILEKGNILITPGHVFGLKMEELWFRVTVSRGKEQFINGLKKIEEILGDNDE